MTTEELEQIRKIVREEIQAETEPVRKRHGNKSEMMQEVSEDWQDFFIRHGKRWMKQTSG